MAKPRKNKVIQCSHFAWRLVNRQGVWYADGRTNRPSAGRHSLGTGDEVEARRLLPQLDQQLAEEMGLAPRSERSNQPAQLLTILDGRKLYEKHIQRPRVTGGVRKSTQKRYRTVFDKFSEFARSRGLSVWNTVTAKTLTDYASYLEEKNYAYKSLVNELTTLKQAYRWMIQAGHLTGVKRIDLKLRKAESEPAYCYTPAEVKAIIEYCQGREDLGWLADVAVALACTGLRIAELSQLRWSDLDLEKGRLTLTDETGRAVQLGNKRRELKSGRSRSFPIHRDWLARLQQSARREGYVFRGPRGGNLKPDTVRRILVREVIKPLSGTFPTPQGAKGFSQGRLHSFRHYFCSTCANSGIPERMVMDWLGHADSEMIRQYYHLHDEESQRRMNELDFLGGLSGRSADEAQGQRKEEGVEPSSPETRDDDQKAGD